jgi:hypothetical protein
MTSTTSCELAINAVSVGTAKSGVPMNTTLIARSVHHESRTSRWCGNVKKLDMNSF